MTEIRVYTAPNGKSPFEKWLSKLGPEVRYRHLAKNYGLSQENTKSLKPLGDGVFEFKYTREGGIRVYLGCEGKEVLILLNGGTKCRQSNDIAKAKELWRNYKAVRTTERKG